MTPEAKVEKMSQAPQVIGYGAGQGFMELNGNIAVVDADLALSLDPNELLSDATPKPTE